MAILTLVQPGNACSNTFSCISHGHAGENCPAPAQALATDVVEAFYCLEPYLKSAVYAFVKCHLDLYADNEDGTQKEFWLSFYNLEVCGMEWWSTDNCMVATCGADLCGRKRSLSSTHYAAL